MNEKNSILEIKHYVIGDKGNGTIYGKNFDTVLDRGNNYLLEPNQKTTVKFKDEYCDYTITINNEGFVPKYSLEAGYSVSGNACSVVVPDNIKKYVTTEVKQIDSYTTKLTTGTPSMVLVGFGFVMFLLLGIVFMNKILNNKKKYVNMND